jgi:hypothetical protein
MVHARALPRSACPREVWSCIAPRAHAMLQAPCPLSVGEEAARASHGSAAVRPSAPSSITRCRCVIMCRGSPPGEGALGGLERRAPHQGTGDACDGSMVWLPTVVAGCALADHERSAVFCLVALDGGFLGVTAGKCAGRGGQLRRIALVCNRHAASVSRCAVRSTSMVAPDFSPARYRDPHTPCTRMDVASLRQLTPRAACGGGIPRRAAGSQSSPTG